VVVSAVFDKTDALVIVIIQPVDLELVVRIGGIKIPAKH
jgi:hypothetical protein